MVCHQRRASANSSFHLCLHRSQGDPHGTHYLGAASGSLKYISSYVETKVMERAENLHCLAEMVVTQPHAAFTALTQSQWYVAPFWTLGTS